MGSSGGGNLKPPNMPTPQGPQVAYGQTSQAMPPQMSYLGTDPTAMMSGLTPEMMNPPAPPPPVQQMSSGPPAQQGQDMRGLLAALMSRQAISDRDKNRYRGGSGSHGGGRG